MGGLAHAAETPAATGGDGGGDTPAIVVTGRRPSLVVLADKLQDTPQSVDVIPQEVLHEQGVTTLQEALKNVPGVTLNSGEGGAHGDTVNLRGFPANDDFFLDGLRDTGFYTRDSFDIENLEVYKGPASTLFGRGSTGGVINQVSKTPKLAPIDTGALTLGTNSEVRGTVDLNQPLSDNAAVRLNLMGIQSDVADRNYVRNSRWGVAPSFAIGLGQKTTFTLTYLHQEENDVPDYGIPFVFGHPAPVPRDTYYGLPSVDRTKSDVDIVTARLTHEFNAHVAFTETARYGNYDYSQIMTAPHFGATAPAAGTPLSSILVYSDRPSSSGVVKTAMSESDLTFTFSTGPFAHTLILGLEADHEEADLSRYANQINQIAPTPLLDPNPNRAFPGPQTVSSISKTPADTLSGLIADTIKLGDHWTLIAGFRYDRFAASATTTRLTTTPATVTHLTHTDYVPSPRVALVYSPTETLSAYLSYGTSYDPSAENLSLSTGTVNLDPEKDRTYEAGVKALLLKGMLTVTGAVFNTEMTNARETDPVTGVPQLAGNLRVNGLEFGAQGYLTRHWEIIAGYTYLDARTTGGDSTPANQIGQMLPNTAHNQANLWTVYEFTDDVRIGAGANYLGRRAADGSGRDFIPSYTTVDAMAAWRLTPQITMQLNAFNLFDKYYFTQAYDSSAVENHVVPGPGRTVTLTAVFSY